jgi:SAM-dependent methyltransferase
MNYYEYVKGMLDRRIEHLQKRANSVLRRHEKQLRAENSPSMEDRLWLEQFAKGRGLDIACGDFLIGDAIGVNTERNYFGCDVKVRGDELTFQDSNGLHFIVTNYLEAMPNPINALNEWHRCLQPGGVLAVVCRDANAYDTKLGPLANRKRYVAYTKVTLSQYLCRAGFTEVHVEETEHQTLRASGVKRA